MKDFLCWLLNVYCPDGGSYPQGAMTGLGPAVPEPTGVVLFLVGLIILALVARRRSK